MLSYREIYNRKSEWAVLLHGLGGNYRIFKKQLDEYSKNFNLLLIDMHGHGESSAIPLREMENPSFKGIAEDIIKVMDHLRIGRAHFVGLSLGTLIIPAVAEIASARIISVVLGGAVVKYTLGARILILLGNILKGKIPYMLLYKAFALIMMPKKNHSKSREVFVREAAKLGEGEFYAWFKLLEQFEAAFSQDEFRKVNIPKLYIMGKQDHMFVGSTSRYAASDENADIHIIDNCGHVCNIDSAEEFNRLSLGFMNSAGDLEASGEMTG